MRIKITCTKPTMVHGPRDAMAWLRHELRNNGRPGYHWPGIGVPKSHLRVFVTIEGDIGSPSPT